MNKSVITAAQSQFNVVEGTSAIARYNVSPGLSAEAKVAVRIEGWGATSGADFGSLLVSFNGQDFETVSDGYVFLPAGTREFFLATRTRSDTESSEVSERIAFVVAQAPEAFGLLDNSYYVSSVASLVDSSPIPPVVAARAVGVVEGEFAVANFSLSGTLGTTASLRVRLEGYSATLGQDTSGDLQVRVNGSGSWKSVSGGMITLEPGTDSFQLRLATVADTQAEAQETFNIVVEQVDGLFANSYYVNSLVTIADAGQAASLAGINGVAPRITAQPFNVVEGEFAVASFRLDAPLSAAAKVTARVEGHSATLGTDTSGTLQVQVGSSGSWVNVGSDGLVTLPAGATAFQLRVATVADQAAEAPETLNFVVAQIDGSFTASHYVSALATLLDGDAVSAGDDPLADEDESAGSQDGAEDEAEGDAEDAADDDSGAGTTPGTGTTTGTGTGTATQTGGTSGGTAGGSAGGTSGSTDGSGTGSTGSGGTSGTSGSGTGASGSGTGTGTSGSGSSGSSSTSKTFTFTESGGLVSFGGSAQGAISITLSATGEASFSREGISAVGKVAAVGGKLIDVRGEEASFIIMGTSGSDTLRFRVSDDTDELFLTGNMNGGADRVLLQMPDDPDNFQRLEFISNLNVSDRDDTFGVIFSQGDDYLVLDPDSNFIGFETLVIRGDFQNIVDISQVSAFEFVEFIGIPTLEWDAVLP